MTTEDAQAMVGIEETIAFQRDLYLFWWAASEVGELALTSRGYLTRASLRRLRGHWPISKDDRAETDDPRSYFLRRLLERLGLLRAQSDETQPKSDVRLVAAEPAMMARFLAHPLAERLRICTRLWVAGGWWPDGKTASVATQLHTPVAPRIALARRRLIEMLAANVPGDAVEIPGVSTAADYGPRIVGATAARRKPRDVAEERNETMRVALAGPLKWIGLVVRKGEDQGSLVVSQGVLALRNEPDDPLVTEIAGRVIIQPNLDIIAYQPLTAPALFTLDRCASRGALERVAHYHLTKADVTRAQQGGWTEDEIVRRLEALSGKPLPGNVRVRLDDWTRAANRLRLTPNATLLTTATPELLEALLADRNARGWVLRRLGPALALVKSGELESVRRWLLARGELPAVEIAEP